MAILKRCVGSKVCVLQFSIFSCAHLGSSARDLAKRPKWSTYVKSEVIGVKSLCLEGLVDYSIHRRYYNIFVRLSRHFWVFFANIAVFCPS